jgi:valyl-tRNA synthetase
VVVKEEERLDELERALQQLAAQEARLRELA